MSNQVYKTWMPDKGIMIVPKTMTTIHEERISGVTIGQMKQWKYLQFSGMFDKHNNPIFEGDICQLLNEAGDTIRVACVYGQAIRELKSGWTVDIYGFMFQSEDHRKTFPIVTNYCGQHDLSIMEIVGNIYQNPELFKLKPITV